jgi:histidinol-phosphate aminotransferase
MSYFRENIDSAAAYVPGIQPKEADSIKLNTNENPYPPSAEVMKVLGEIRPEQLRRYPDPLGEGFRQAAAELNGLKPENIICCNGGDDLLRMALTAFCDKERPLAYPVPTYTLYRVLAKIQNCDVIEIPFDDEFNLPARLAKTGAALTIVCNPNAPSGTLVAAEELASLADELSGVLLIDEAYVDFAEQDCSNLAGQLDNVILLRSMSKGYSLAGIRFGYGMASAGLIDGLMKVKDSYNVDAVALAAATAAIRDQKHLRENVEKVKTERARLADELRELGFLVPDSAANFVLATCDGCDAADVHEKLAGRNIYVRYFRIEGLEDKLRITVGTKEQNDALISALADILKE